MNPTKHFVFVAGSFHASWCWFKMQPLLNKDGNTSTGIDLPAHGHDRTPPNEVTLDSYVDIVCRALEQFNKPVILIGHSRAGIVISQVAERMPEKIDQLVYLCAFLIPNGSTMVETAMADAESLLAANLIFNKEEGWHFTKEDMFRDIFYHDCVEEDIALCSALLTPEPNAPVATPLQLSADRYGKVEKVYVHTTKDKALTHDIQQMMVAREHVDRTFTIDASHSPFLSQPRQLADILLEL